MTKKPVPPPGIVPDSALWEEVKRAVRPLKPSGRSPSHTTSKPRSSPASYAPIAATKQNSAADPPPLTGLDRRTSQKLTRGLIAYEAKLDLHGANIEQARLQLLRFLSQTRARGIRLVLVVTGKGASPYARHTLHGDSHYHVPERQGRLRRFVSEWLHEAEFREHVSGFQPAHPRHGGGGAYYIRLRRRHRVS
jgi:DNA-nicking Smr family endonuclease